MKYQTKQRSEIQQFLLSHPEEHFTAEQLQAELKESGISRATLYRTLQVMLLEGKVRKYEAGEGQSACYQCAMQPACAEHYHMKCRSCGRLIHMQCDMLRDLEEHIMKEHHFRLDPARTVFYGICEQCQRRE